ncbi:bifunctional metallophosphatase/5'-nucleotidase [Heyndrickxia coagulans]|uniref:bifunctional metallophosphatase/5'-nucleotidase n=1 Tax=Heyndrickxia coagulans TaxID=1398 RepID=UPI0008F8CFF1|nr:bifunctional UDP-sugar hydrolase/5'-nucleotidase [Heyndrickxia coagulans]APB38337.1 bifunctional metallophosphatase/5'-nucleotidase [Heyndrickxia coagulans]QPG54067.1 bifunctional metallophosphatase/5'-nucleotidase [Heyndrickxia coagulans]WNE62145.1 bifunctional metallophosphatase/5'-nucleotidase [Heyndrickxia coagulans]
MENVKEKSYNVDNEMSKRKEIGMKTFELVILETSDIHGNILPINYGTNEEAAVGLAKISTLVKTERARQKHVLLLDNGDLIQGTPLTYYYARIDSEGPNPMVLAANALQYDAAVPGNHEFNYGQALLLGAVKESHFPWLSANILNEQTKMPYFGRPYIIKKFAEGLKVAVLGLTTPYIPNWEQPQHISGMLFADPVETAKQWVKFLREKEQADIVILSYHGGFERDLDSGEPTEDLTGENQGYQLCQKVSGIDVLLTGHQHRMIAGKAINGVTVVQPGNNGRAVGKVVLQLEKQQGHWRCVQKTSELLFVETVKADPAIISLAKPYEEATQAWLDQPIGKIEGDMLVHNPMEVRLKDHPLIEFMNRVQMEATGADISCTALFDNQSPGFPENVTMRDVVSNYIYPNTFKVIRITGADIKAALERSASYFKTSNGGTIEVNPAFSNPKPQHYNYDMWEGIDYVIDLSKPVGKRIVKLEYKGKPVDPAAEYDVVMNNYRAGGGGDYLMFKGKPVVKDVQIDAAELMANYILERKVIRATVDHNWKVIF